MTNYKEMCLKSFHPQTGAIVIFRKVQPATGKRYIEAEILMPAILPAEKAEQNNSGYKKIMRRQDYEKFNTGW